MRLITLCLAALLVLIQYPLWLGKGGWLRVWDLDEQVSAAQKKNDELRARNAKLGSEVRDLRDGTAAVEERARYELGMIKENEVFIQVVDANGPPIVSAAPKSAAMTKAVAPGKNATAGRAAVATKTSATTRTSAATRTGATKTSATR